MPPEPVVDVLWLRACALRLLGVCGTWPTEEHTEWEEVASEEIEVEDILNKRKGYTVYASAPSSTIGRNDESRGGREELRDELT